MTKQHRSSQISILMLCWSLSLSMADGAAFTFRAETICALACHMSFQCNGYDFKDYDAYLSDKDSLNWSGNCLLLDRSDSMPGVHTIPQPEGFYQTNLVKSHTRGITHTIKIPGGGTKFSGNPLNGGYDLAITVKNTTIFFKEINANHTYDQAMLECLSWGGILPMEITDEIVEEMSALSGDFTTPRFISLAYERKIGSQENFLIWTLGQEEWKESDGLSSCPRCQTWVLDPEAKNLWFKINPVTKMYEPVLPGETTLKYHCQYLGKNLAINQRASASSIYNHAHRPETAVDGLAHNGAKFWHSLKFTPGGEWISINIGSTYWITNVLLLGRLDKMSDRNHGVEIWVGGREAVSGTTFTTSGRTFCEVFPFQQRNDQLNGVTCQYPMQGHVVTFLTFKEGMIINFMEVAIYGYTLT